MSNLLKTLFLIPLFYSNSVLATVSHAYIVDTDNAVRYVSSDGKVNEAKSEKGFALSVSVGSDGSVWVVSTDQGNVDRGGNLVKVMPKGQTNWVTVTIEQGVEAIRVSGDASGGAWIIDGETTEAVQISQSGKILYASDKDSFMAISAAFSDTNPSSNQIWGILSQAQPKIGNPVVYLTSIKGEWKPRGVGAQALSGYWLVKGDGSIETAASDSSFHTMAPPNTASSISVGKSGSIWVVSLEANMNQGGAYLKVWDEQGTGSKNWVKVPNVGARSVSAQ
jgi:hypothetical protein